MINAFCKKPLWECTRTLADVAQGSSSGRCRGEERSLGERYARPKCRMVWTSPLQRGALPMSGRRTIASAPATQVIDAEGCYIAPGFLDGHVHVWSLPWSAQASSRAPWCRMAPRGIYWDPHEVCNVLGLEGVRIMMQDVQRTPLKAMVTTPSCVPAVPGFEDTGAAIGPNDIAETMAWDSVVGLGEMMNFVGIVNGREQPHAEVAETLKAGKIVTGHYASSETDRGLGAYAASGARCCHGVRAR